MKPNPTPKCAQLLPALSYSATCSSDFASSAGQPSIFSIRISSSVDPKGYVIQVAGFADSVGAASSNQVLSKERAQAVVAYLLQESSIPVGRIVAPGAMGKTKPAASNETRSGRKRKSQGRSQAAGEQGYRWLRRRRASDGVFERSPSRGCGFRICITCVSIRSSAQTSTPALTWIGSSITPL